MADTNFAMGDADDLPRTLRREKEARERAKREDEARKRSATLTHDYDARERAAATGSERNAYAAPLGGTGSIVTGFDVPFFHLVRFFIKAVFAAVPALVILGVMLWFAGAALKSVYPGLIHTEVVIRVPR